MNEWSEKWNALPLEIRLIGSKCETQMRINQLEMEKKRLKQRYLQSIKEVNEHIANLRHYLEER
jgi:predicted patatin/cPLA2 family phospholipase